MEVTVSNHMAALEDDTVAKILAKAAGKAKNPVAAALVKPPKTIEAAKPAKERDHTAALKAKKTPPPIVEPPKVEKKMIRSEEHTSELQSRLHLVCRLLLEKKKKTRHAPG